MPAVLAALLALAVSLLADLSPPLAGLSAAAVFLLGTPVLDALHERLLSRPALLGASGLILLAMLGALG